MGIVIKMTAQNLSAHLAYGIKFALSLQQIHDIMKALYTILAIIFLFSANLKGQTYTYLYNPYSGYNKAQLNLALEQSQKMKRNGMVWTVVGTGLTTGGTVMTIKGIQKLTAEYPANFGTFAAGLGVACFGIFPLTFGLAAWFTGNEKINQIEIELLAFNKGSLDFKPTENGLGLVLAF